MNTRLYASIAMALIGLSTAAVTHPAEACGLNQDWLANGQWSIAPPTRMTASTASKMFLAAAARNLATASQTRTHAIPNPLQLLEPLTGMYSVTFTAEGNAPPGPRDGTVLDQAYVTWHADGTELMNSQSALGGLCMGVWKQTGAHTYTLNHYALPFNPVTHAFIGPLNVREDLTWSRDYDSYSGNATYTQYAPDGVTVLPPIVHAVVSGTRINP